MQYLDLFVAAVTCVALVVSVLLVWKICGLKASFIEEHKDSVEQVLAAVGVVESLHEAELRAPVIVEAMQRYNVARLSLRLGSGERVNFRLGSSGHAVKSA